MGEKGSQSGRISQTEQAIDTIVRPGSVQRSSVPAKPQQSSIRAEALRVSYVAGCFVTDAVILPIVLAYALEWMWVFVMAIILVPIVYVEYRGYQRLFGLPGQVHHVPSDHIPEFHAADGDAAPEIDERE